MRGAFLCVATATAIASSRALHLGSTGELSSISLISGDDPKSLFDDATAEVKIRNWLTDTTSSEFFGKGVRSAEEGEEGYPLQIVCRDVTQRATRSCSELRLRTADNFGFDLELLSRAGVKGENQDNLFFRVFREHLYDPREGTYKLVPTVGVFAVLDGHGQMGAEASARALDVAARAARGRFRQFFRRQVLPRLLKAAAGAEPAKLAQLRTDLYTQPLENWVRHAIRDIFLRANEAVELMTTGQGGSTFTLVVWDHARIYFAAAGDSPAYIVDHDLRQFVRAGDVGGAESFAHNRALWDSLQQYFRTPPTKDSMERLQLEYRWATVDDTWQRVELGAATRLAPERTPYVRPAEEPFENEVKPAYAEFLAEDLAQICAAPPVLHGGPVDAGTEPGAAFLSYSLLPGRAPPGVDAVPGLPPFGLPVMRIGQLMPARSLGDSLTIMQNVVTSPSFVRSDPVINVVNTRKFPISHILIGSDGFSNAIEWMHRAILRPKHFRVDCTAQGAPTPCFLDYSVLFAQLADGLFDHFDFPPGPFLHQFGRAEDFIQLHAHKWAFDMLEESAEIAAGSGTLDVLYDKLRKAEQDYFSPWGDDLTAFSIQRVPGALTVNEILEDTLEHVVRNAAAVAA